MPGEHRQSSFSKYLNVLGELEGFIDSNPSDFNIIVGDFNVDFDCSGLLNDLLTDFV